MFVFMSLLVSLGVSLSPVSPFSQVVSVSRTVFFSVSLCPCLSLSLTFFIALCASVSLIKNSKNLWPFFPFTINEIVNTAY